jgi:hypothetical protein
MKGLDWFIVGVRLLGVWFLAQAVMYGVTFLDVALGMTPLRGDVTTPNVYLLYGAGNLLLALFFLFGAEPVAGWCYGRARADRGKRRFVDEEEDEFSEQIVRRDPNQTPEDLPPSRGFKS